VSSSCLNESIWNTSAFATTPSTLKLEFFIIVCHYAIYLSSYFGPLAV
jgi:hypothetical protein